MKHVSIVLTVWLCAVCARAEDSAKPAEAPDPEKISYAVGMRLGMQIKRSDADVNPDKVAQGIKDVLEGKPTQLQPSELPAIFAQAQASATNKKGAQNREEGEEFLSRNALEPGVTVLPDGLQYRVIKQGAGESPKSNSIVNISYHCKFIDGQEFESRDHIYVRTTAPVPGVEEALKLMKPGAKWEIFVPGQLAYGKRGRRELGPDRTLIYELELLAVKPPDFVPADESRGTMGHPIHHLEQPSPANGDK